MTSFFHKGKAVLCLIAVMLLLICTAATAESLDHPLLLLTLPQDAQMIEDVEFDDGDFIQTYQLSGGAHVTLLRYTDFSMGVHDLLQSEWDGAKNVSVLNVNPISEQHTESLRFTYQEDDQETYYITLLTVFAGQDTLVFEAVYPERIGEQQISSTVESMIHSMTLTNVNNDDLG